MNTTGLFRKTLIMLAFMLSMVFGIAFFLPSTFHVERTLIIETAPDKPFSWINDLEKVAQVGPVDTSRPEH